MRLSILFSRTALFAVSVGWLCIGASAQYAARGARTLGEARAVSIGGGSGSIHMPTADQEGLLVGILVDDKDGKRFTLEATLTSWIPGLFGSQTRVAMGGLYGKLSEFQGYGMLQDAEAERAGRVEGIWRMEQNLSGSYIAQVYERTDAGLEAVTGIIEGKFRVQELEGAVPGPQRPDLVAHRMHKDQGDVGAELPNAGKTPAKKLHRLHDAASNERASKPRSAYVGASESSSPSEFGDARSSAPVLGDARSAGKPSDPGRQVGAIDPGLGSKKRPVFGEAAGAGSAGANVVKGAWGSAAGARFSTPSPRSGRVVWPVLGGEFRAEFLLMAID